MTDIEQLKQSLYNLVENPTCTFSDIINALEPFSDYISNTQFTDNITQIINIIILDRNNDQKFTFDDIKLLCTDIPAITSIINCTMAIIASLPGVQVTSTSGLTQELVFKILVYIFLVVIPYKLNMEWTVDQKKEIIDVALFIYNMIISSGLAKDLINKIKQLFIKKGWCKCICGQQDKQQVLEENLPKMMLELGTNLTSFRNMSLLRYNIGKQI